jgi:2-phosphosulfolactate phosphatase
MVTALANGAEAIRPVQEIGQAVVLGAKDGTLVLAGERDGVMIRKDLTGSIDFHFGNSPREFTADEVRGRRIVMTTTNGTRALRACAGAKQVLVGSFLNLQATADMTKGANELLVICSGTFEEAAYEDTLAAGALCDLVWPQFKDDRIADSAVVARRLWNARTADLAAALAESRNGRRLLSRPELSEDVTFCARLNAFSFCAEMDKDGWVSRQS